jgi:hypothetical protein
MVKCGRIHINGQFDSHRLADRHASHRFDHGRLIRAAIHKDKSLSTYAHNVKIITQGGKVTLKGPIHSEAEKSGEGHGCRRG